jgi:hypothetical protein
MDILNQPVVFNSVACGWQDRILWGAVSEECVETQTAGTEGLAIWTWPKVYSLPLPPNPPTPLVSPPSSPPPSPCLQRVAGDQIFSPSVWPEIPSLWWRN